jgi:hypothetical protein
MLQTCAAKLSRESLPYFHDMIINDDFFPSLLIDSFSPGGVT